MQRQYEQMIVPLDEIRLNPDNPRQDMGDLEALARSFADNGGEPINPPIVARDGDGYRLFDGERRVRAMRSIGTEMCTVLCYSGFLAAQAAVASMATDQKLRLSDTELARGFQTCFEAGVSDEEAANATGIGIEKVRRVRSVAKDAPGQTSLGAMLVAAEFEDPEDRKRIMGSKGSPEAEASQIRRERKRDAAVAKVREALVAAGMPEDRIHDEPLEYARAQELGIVTVAKVDGPKDVKAAAEDVDLSRAEAWRSKADWEPAYRLYLPASEAAGKPDRGQAAREAVSELNRLAKRCAMDACRWVTYEWGRVSAAGTDLMGAVAKSRNGAKFDDLGDDGTRNMLVVSKPSLYETASWVADRLGFWPFEIDYGKSRAKRGARAEEAAEAIDLLVGLGWRMPEGVPAELRAALTDDAVLAQLEAKVSEGVGSDGEDR